MLRYRRLPNVEITGFADFQVFAGLAPVAPGPQRPVFHTLLFYCILGQYIYCPRFY
jgi:hypothetical protein